MTLARSFYSHDTRNVARDLLGKLLVHTTSQGTTSGIIVETEAYLQNDPASHSFRGKTPRNSSMFLGPGHAYVYLIYGVHYCVNAVTNKEGVGEAVLIRALEPLEGIALMQKRTGEKHIASLCRGPAKLCRAMGITKEQDGADLTRGALTITAGPVRTREPTRPHHITATRRIGITKAAHSILRFHIMDNAHVSSRKRRTSVKKA